MVWNRIRRIHDYGVDQLRQGRMFLPSMDDDVNLPCQVQPCAREECRFISCPRYHLSNARTST
jgi:hypothetical protein